MKKTCSRKSRGTVPLIGRRGVPRPYERRIDAVFYHDLALGIGPLFAFKGISFCLGPTSNDV
jgi:hypothetical protein